MYVLRKIIEYRRLLLSPPVMGSASFANVDRRLGELERWLADRGTDDRREQAGDHPTPRRFRRFEMSCPVSFETSSRKLTLQVVDVGAGGLALAPAPAMQPGLLGVVGLSDPDEGCLYHLPVETRWTARRAFGIGIGCAFVGPPAVIPFGPRGIVDGGDA